MKKKLLTIFVVGFFLTSQLYAITVPGPWPVNISFVKSGITNFGFYGTSNENEMIDYQRLSSIVFPIVTNPNATVVTNDDIYIKWAIYVSAGTTYSLDLELKSNPDDSTGPDWGLRGKSKSGETEETEIGLNYYVKESSGTNIINPLSGDAITSQVEASLRKAEITSNKSDSSKIIDVGQKKITLVIDPPGEGGFTNASYTGYMVLTLTTDPGSGSTT